MAFAIVGTLLHPSVREPLLVCLSWPLGLRPFGGGLGRKSGCLVNSKHWVDAKSYEQCRGSGLWTISPAHGNVSK